MKPVLVERRGTSLVLTLNVPKKRNVLSPELLEAMHEGLDLALSDDAVSAVILQGANGFFCAGGDLDALAGRASMTLAERVDRIEILHVFVRRLRSFPKPVIAAVEGGAAGAGASIALVADLLVAAENSSITMSYVKAGLVPDGGATASLLRGIPQQLATEITLLGEPFPATRLAALGVVNRLAAPGTALDVALKMADRLARGPRVAQASILGLLDSAAERSFEEQLDRERQQMAEALGGTEAAEGIAAFREKRLPNFSISSAPILETGQ